MPAIYRGREINWTQGACGRGVKQRQYFLVKMEHNRVAFARARDCGNFYADAKNNIRKRANLKTYEAGEILTGLTPEGKSYLAIRDWKFAKISEEELPIALRPKIKEPFEQLPEEAVATCLDDLMLLTTGPFSKMIMKQTYPELDPKSITGVAIEATGYSLLVSNQGILIKRDFQRFSMPPALGQALENMGLSLYVFSSAIRNTEVIPQFIFLLKNLKSSVINLQRMSYRTNRDVKVALQNLTIRAESAPDTGALSGLWIKGTEAATPGAVWSVISRDALTRS